MYNFWKWNLPWPLTTSTQFHWCPHFLFILHIKTFFKISYEDFSLKFHSHEFSYQQICSWHLWCSCAGFHLLLLLSLLYSRVTCFFLEYTTNHLHSTDQVIQYLFRTTWDFTQDSIWLSLIRKVEVISKNYSARLNFSVSLFLGKFIKVHNAIKLNDIISFTSIFYSISYLSFLLLC